MRLSFGRIAPFADLITERFYAKVFDAAPEVRKIFPADMRAQRSKLVELLTYIVNNLDKREEIDASLASLGQRHQSYGVQRVHFVVVRAALIETLAESKEIRLTPAELSVWDNLLRYISAEMGVRLSQAA